jgi:transglutaminase superfamily protein
VSGTRLGKARSVVSGPGELLLSGRMVLWAGVLPVLKRTVPLSRLVTLMAPRHRSAPDAKRTEDVVTLARWLYRTRALRDNCLERSLITYRYLPAGNENSLLILGVRKGDDGPPGHAWLMVNGVPVHDSDETLEKLVPVVAFDLEGRRLPPPKPLSARRPAAPA